jgi:hypothetical protein
MVFGGPTFWALEDTPELMAAYREFIVDAPRELGGFFAFHIVPPAPPFPEALHLRKVCGVVWCHTGGEEEASTAMAPMLAVKEPLMHGVQQMPLPVLNSAFDGLYAPGDQWYWRADFLTEIPDPAIEANLRWADGMPTFKSGSHLYPIDGAAHDVPKDATAWSHRDAVWSQVIIGVDPDPAGAATIRDWAVGYEEAIRPYSTGAAYSNFMGEGDSRVQATYGEHYDRLASIKTKYDPDNVFRVNQNIAPKA